MATLTAIKHNPAIAYERHAAGGLQQTSIWDPIGLRTVAGKPIG